MCGEGKSERVREREREREKERERERTCASVRTCVCASVCASVFVPGVVIGESHSLWDCFLKRERERERRERRERESVCVRVCANVCMRVCVCEFVCARSGDGGVSLTLGARSCFLKMRDQAKVEGGVILCKRDVKKSEQNR
jgi:hypothetical protein